MAVDKKISQLTSLAQGDVDAALDVLPIVDTSANETKKITVTALVSAGATAGISGAVLTNGTINSTTIGATTPSTGAFTTLSASGNLTFSSTAQRITGDMSNATVANRLMFQTSTANSTTALGILPNGTGQVGQLNLFGGSDPANTSLLAMLCSTAVSEARLSSGITGTGTYLPMTFYTGGSERMRLDTSGNLGLGTASPGSRLVVGNQSAIYGGGTTNENIAIVAGTPPSADTTRGMFGIYDQTSAAAGVGGSITFGGSFSGTTQTFFAGIKGVKANATPADATGDLLLAPRSGNTIFYGAMYSSERMRIDSSGNLGIGTTSPSANSPVHINKSTAADCYFRSQNSLASSVFGTSAGGGTYIYNGGAYPLLFYTNDTERMRLDSSGNVGIGGTAAAFSKLAIAGTLPTSSNLSVGLDIVGTIPSGTTSGFDGVLTRSVTAAAAFTLTNLHNFRATQGTLGAGSTVTNQYGFVADSSLTGATNNFGFYSNIASGSNRWNFYAAGTAQNYFAGDTGVGTTPLASVRLGVLSAGTTSGTFAILARDSSSNDLFSVRSDGLFQTGLKAESPANKTTATAANVVVDTGTGALLRSTSSLRYKTAVVDAAHGLADVLKLRSVTYKGKNDGDKVFGGLIAEEVHDAGLTEFVAYDKEGRPDALHYGNMVALLVKAVQELKAELEALKAA